MLAQKSQYFAVLVMNRLQCEIQTIQTTQQTKTSDQISPSVVDLGPAQPPIVDIFLARYFPQTAQNKICLDILWGNPGSEYTKLLGKFKIVYHIFN